MASNQDNNTAFNPDEQLVRLRSWCRDSAPAFYADQADYLRLLRNYLPHAVQTALGELLCGIDRDRLNHVSDQARVQLLERIEQLVKRCSTLLTIEQLQLLARDLAREQRIQRRQLQKAMVESLQRGGESSNSTEIQLDPEQPAADAEPSGRSGSVTLNLSPPIDQPDLLEGLLPPRQPADPVDESASSSGDNPDEGSRDEGSGDEVSDSDAVLGLNVEFEDPPAAAEQSSSESDSAQAGSDLALLRSLFVMAGQAMESEDEASRAHSDPIDEPFPVNSSDASEYMPSMPLELQRWMEGLEQAIKRRLRNLSHAINVELLRAGLVTSLLPLSLLDAVLSGQLETLPSPSNLLRLRVPMPMTAHGGDELIDLICVLLRPAELEFDLLPLRRSRSKLRQRKRSLLTMVRQQRHWQRRAQTHQVQQQWWQSPPNSSPQI